MRQSRSASRSAQEACQNGRDGREKRRGHSYEISTTVAASGDRCISHEMRWEIVRTGTALCSLAKVSRGGHCLSAVAAPLVHSLFGGSSMSTTGNTSDLDSLLTEIVMLFNSTGHFLCDVSLCATTLGWDFS